MKTEKSTKVEGKNGTNNEIIICDYYSKEELALKSKETIAKNTESSITAKFWSKTANGRINFEQKKLIDYLSVEGFGKYYLDKNGYVIVKKDTYIIREVDIVTVKEFLIRGLKNQNDEGVLSEFYEKIEYMVSKIKLEVLPTLTSSIFRDNKEEVFFTFKNVFVKVSKDKLEKKLYTEIPDGCAIFESQIIKSSFEETQDKSEFEMFIYNVANKNENRFNSIKSSIGYLLHRFNNPTESKAIIFTDEHRGYEGEANGGTGKSLVAIALGYMRNISHEDGKSFKSNKNFAFQGVNHDSEIICLNDVNKDFDLENFYSILTDGLTIEKKYRNSYRISPELLPKMLVTSNYIVGGRIGFTDDRRRFEVEFSPYYGKSLSPAMEFGHMFFNDWNDDEWCRFFNFMVNCVQLYMNKGLIAYKHVNMDIKRMVSKTSEEFVTFFRSQILDHLKDNPIEHEKKILFERYNNITGSCQSARTFTVWLRTCCNISSIKVLERESNSKSFIRLARL